MVRWPRLQSLLSSRLGYWYGGGGERVEMVSMAHQTLKYELTLFFKTHAFNPHQITETTYLTQPRLRSRGLPRGPQRCSKFHPVRLPTQRVMPWRYHPANPRSSTMPIWLREFNSPHPPRTHPTPRSRFSALRHWGAPIKRQIKCTSRYIILVHRNLGTRTRSGHQHVYELLCLVRNVLFESCCRANRTEPSL